MKILFGLVGLLIVFLIVMVIVDSNRFHTVSYIVKTDKVKTPFHFVFLSDLHNKSYGRMNGRLLDAIDAIAPEAVLIGGDLLTARPNESLDVAYDFLKELKNKYPIYYANGNHEQRFLLYPEKYGQMGTDYESLLQGIGIHRLVNGQKKVDGTDVCITGCEIDRRYYKRLKHVEMERGYITSILPKKMSDCFQIMMAHNPDYFEQYAAYGADLILSGHNHGGVVRIPGIGGVISTNFTLFPRYDGGKIEKNGVTMIVSRGLGAHTIPFRLFNPGELVEITVKPC